MTTLSEMFLEGNILFMSVLTFLLAILFLAAWKAPAWVRDVGSIALAFGILFGLLGIRQVFSYMQTVDEVAPSVLYGGYKCTTIPVVYGLIIFIISLIIHLCQKPRI